MMLLHRGVMVDAIASMSLWPLVIYVASIHFFFNFKGGANVLSNDSYLFMDVNVFLLATAAIDDTFDVRLLLT
jgi:hypothetical protein